MWSFLRRPRPKRCPSLVQHWSPNPAETAQQRLTTSPECSHGALPEHGLLGPPHQPGEPGHMQYTGQK